MIIRETLLGNVFFHCLIFIIIEAPTASRKDSLTKDLRVA